MRIEEKQVTRRGFIQTVGALGAACMASSLIPGRLHAADAPAAPAVDMDALMVEKIGSATFKEGKVVLSVPDKVENGGLVPLSVKIDHPMEPGNFVEKVAIFVDKNRNPYTGSFTFTPESGAARFDINIKMGEPSNVRIVAKTSKGEYLGLVKAVTVTAGGCGG